MPYFDKISHGCTCVLHPEHRSHLPPHPIPLGHPRAPAQRTHASDLDWRSVSHMVIYMFQCYSLKSSHPRLVPQSPKVCSLHLCLFCCLAHRVSVPIFLNSTYEYYLTLDYGRTLQAVIPLKPFVIRGTVYQWLLVQFTQFFELQFPVHKRSQGYNLQICTKEKVNVHICICIYITSDTRLSSLTECRTSIKLRKL